MQHPHRSCFLATVFLCLLIFFNIGHANNLSDTEKVEFFNSQVKPILEQNCFRCHGGGDEVKGGLQLTSRENILKGGDYGSAVSLENPTDSFLLQMVGYGQETAQMPPDGRLDDTSLEILAKWINIGLPYPIQDDDAQPVSETATDYWAYRPLKRPQVPSVRSSDWVRNPIDAFILAKLEANSLTPAAPAGKLTLIRRMYYDLTGLPPSPEAVEAFLNNTAPNAYEKLIDKLLKSPRYGEKWGRHWLDLVRYAETNGYESDSDKPYVWRYRDYVINAFNKDKPYNEFIKEQLAGDELDAVTTETIIATGYHKLGVWDDGPADRKLARYDYLDDIVSTTGQVMLGMTVGCARCHDHKIDPISTRDYYSFLAFFHDITPNNRAPLADIGTPEQQAVRDKLLAEKRLAEQEVEDKLFQIQEIIKIELTKIHPEAIASDTETTTVNFDELLKTHAELIETNESLKALVDKYQNVKKQRDQRRRQRVLYDHQALAVSESKQTPTHILRRGNPHLLGREVKPAFPAVLNPPAVDMPPVPEDAKSSGKRRIFAEWVASAENPLTARVMVNRIWQYHFGRGIVRSSNDFGQLGTPPTHPELLDWLASEFIASGWRLKAMHKLIMTSNAYRMSAQSNPRCIQQDANNDLCWRFDMRRLTAEEIRDTVLWITGKLNLKMEGPSIFPELPKEVLATSSRPGHVWGQSPPDEANRRSIYVKVKRSLLVPILNQYDQANTDSTCPVRFSTTVPTQSLTMLNGKFINDQAIAFANRMRWEGGVTVKDRVQFGLRLMLCREPEPAEIQQALAFMEELQQHESVSAEVALDRFALLALNLNEFIFLD